MNLTTIPPTWIFLVSELNGQPIDGTPGIRDVHSPCEDFQPVGKPFELSPGDGTCDTDGHYICSECVHISTREARHRRDECEACGTKLITINHMEECPECDRIATP